MGTSRRDFLTAGVSMGFGLGLSGCAGFVNPIQPVCANDPSISDPSTPLTIDVHAHVFNGSDLQVNGFLTRVLRIRGIGPILQYLAWNDAPNAQQELSELTKISSVLRQCDITAVNVLVDQHRQQQYSLGRAQLIESARRIQRSPAVLSANTSEFIRQIDALPPDYPNYRRSKSVRGRIGTASLTPGGAIDFILRNFQYRYVNVFDYLNEYSSGRERRVDLIAAHLVDYDWPIGDGRETETTIPDQIRVMREISILTSGRVHCFVPFDPFKQVAYELGLTPYSPLAVASDAILNDGFLGIKMYPPMGFQPFGNALKPAAFWSDAYLPKALQVSDIGQRLDKALGDLYQWCLTNDVAIMAHSAPTNSPTKHVDDLTNPAWWDLALQTFEGLRINFGHFGDTDEVNHGIGRPLSFAGLMTSIGPGANAYADSAYFADAVKQPAKLLPDLKQLLRATSNKGSAALAQRLMYGTDWEMIIIEGRTTNDYLKSFEGIFAKLDTDTSLGAQGRLSDRFFGQNAANYLGLHRGSATRARLEAFYRRSGVSAAPLLSKVDGAPFLAGKM